MRGSLRPGLAQGNTGASVLCSAILRPPSCPAFPRPGFAARAPRGLMHQGRIGTMRALTPGALAHARQVSPLSRLAVRTSHPQTRGAPRHPFSSPQGTRWTLRPRLRHHCAGSPLHAAETGSSSCGLPVRLRLLPTPPRGDAVTFGYMCRDRSHGLDLHLPDKSDITVARNGRADQIETADVLKVLAPIWLTKVKWPGASGSASAPCSTGEPRSPPTLSTACSSPSPAPNCTHPAGASALILYIVDRVG